MTRATPWHTLPPEETLARQGTSLCGLTPDEVARRLARHGANELRREAPIRPVVLLLGQFRSLLVILLAAAAAVSGIVGEWADAVAILAIVVLNAGIGFYQEYSAERSLAALRRMTAPRARVRRGGASLSVPAAALVPGDVVEMEAGDIVPADARLVEVVALTTVEAPLTGESEPVRKDAAPITGEDTPLAERRNMVFMGTSIGAGRAVAVVTATGMDTEIGHIAGMLEEAAGDGTTPLQERLAAFGRLLVWGALGVVALVFLLGLLRGTAVFELLLTSVSLAVAAVPEGLPAVVTIALSVGVWRMARRRALVRRLPAVETLGSADVICTDKTGTLTVGEMTVRRMETAHHSFDVGGEGYAPEGRILVGGAEPDAGARGELSALLAALAGCNDAQLVHANGTWRVLGDPTEGALLAAAGKGGIRRELLEAELPRVGEIPFDSDRKRMTVVRRHGPGATRRALVKGAPEELLPRCSALLGPDGVLPMREPDRSRILDRGAAMAKDALRVLAAAYRDLGPAETLDADRLERDLVFVGLAGMHDPPRPEAREAVARCRAAGIRVVMITGDHPRTAGAIARDLGIAGAGDDVVTGPEIDALGDAEFAARVPAVAVYARVTAEHKLRIVRAWKAHGRTVAMTGDGVNDAPAIKGADIGVAMGLTGTEVTKEASDMVITDDNFASIVAAVEEGRGIYANIRKTLQYLLAGNTGELLLVLGAVALGLPAPLAAIQLLWINLLTDGLPALCLATDPMDPSVMEAAPRGRAERLADRAFLSRMLLTGTLTAGVAFVAYAASLRLWDDLAMARAHAFSTLVFAELLRSFGCRSDTTPFWSRGAPANRRLALVVSASALIQVASPHLAWLGSFLDTPTMPFTHCLALLALSFVPALVLELLKVVRPRREGVTQAAAQGGHGHE